MTAITARSTGVTTTSTQDVIALVGRILIAYLFIPAGFGKLMGFAGTVGYVASSGLPLPQVGAALAILVELGVGIAFLLGYKTRVAAIVLAVFTVLAAFFFHKYWAVPEAMKMMQQINFNKNIAIAGGLLGFAAFGPGRLSIDKR
ncbi:DoxX family protein [Variovorax guangxiensis]|uniref:DoxX family protein n=1 Tax=Variovorax guangxiensis TaxID=1775474 RepID=A0A502E1S8_9BURK|nr:DoxX family protein [Variovorax guangxiensis]TPG26746.1 DoxX family protein [Variovorax ginsengisoli]TPG30471.1 DoxX family protein [Variovorax guangxiensis]